MLEETKHNSLYGSGLPKPVYKLLLYSLYGWLFVIYVRTNLLLLCLVVASKDPVHWNVLHCDVIHLDRGLQSWGATTLNDFPALAFLIQLKEGLIITFWVVLDQVNPKTVLDDGDIGLDLGNKTKQDEAIELEF